jgi:hypothetical protein
MQRLFSNEAKCLYLLGLLAVVALISCRAEGREFTLTPTPTLEPSLIDSSILTGLPCAAPCWYGLEIGRSTKSDILATARTLSFIDSKEFPEDPFYYWDPSKRADVVATLIRLRCRSPERGPCASLVVLNNVLKEIYLSPPPAFTLGQAVVYLGPPDYFEPLARIESTLCDVALIWKQRGIWIAFRSGSPQKVQCRDVHGSKDVSPNLLVAQIIYGSPDDYIFARASEPGGGLPWSGFAQP